MPFLLPHKVGLSLKLVNSIFVRFCPFESNVESTRYFLECIFAKKAHQTNTRCNIRTEVKHDRSEPVIDITFVDGERLIMKGANLTTKDLIDVFKKKCEIKELKKSGKETF